MTLLGNSMFKSFVGFGYLDYVLIMGGATFHTQNGILLDTLRLYLAEHYSKVTQS